MAERAKILIVEDEPLNVNDMEQELAEAGYQVVGVRNREEALAKAASEAPDLILLDVTMPGMDGFAVCRRLKEHPETQLIPVVMMTALEASEDRIRGIEAGADDFLMKPVNPRELHARIRTAVRWKQAVDHKVDELRQIKDHFAKFVPEAVKRLVLANPHSPDLGVHKQDVSVLFVDISGYSALSEQLSANKLNRVVERYFSAFCDHIQEAGGDINKTAGDGFMAIFQDVDRCAHAQHAVETALALLRTTAALNRTSGDPPLSIHMGINAGVALVGSVRFEGLHSIRWAFTAGGPVTNLAARLAEAATASQILVGQEIVRRLSNRYRFESLNHTRLKNFSLTTKIYRILSSSGSFVHPK